MDDVKLADLTLGINPQAWAVAHMLSTQTMSGIAHAETAPWYNGRECGLVFSFSAKLFDGPCLRIAVFEHRNSDYIHALKWAVECHTFNPPSFESEGKLAYPTDNKWDTAFSVAYGECGKMVAWIYDEVVKYAEEMKTPVSG